MVACPNCGRESDQPGASYCLYCGSSLTASRQPSPAMSAVQTTPSSYGTVASAQSSERYQRALARAERLGTVVAVLAVVTLILVLV